MIIKKEIFDREIAMCRKLYKKSKGCKWGKCADCGVVPFLYKIYKEELVEDKKDVKTLKDKVLR